MTIPYIGFGNDTLKELPHIKAGDKIVCPHCGEEHTITESKAEGDSTFALQFYRCSDGSYVAGINGASIIGVEPDVSSSREKNDE